MKATMRADVLETIPDLLYAVDLEGRVTHWNRRVEEMTGLSADELLGRPAVAFFPEHDRERVAAAMAHAVETGFGEVEAELILADGSLRPFHYSGAPLRDESGAVVGLTGIGRDISERHKTEKRNTALLEIARDSSGTFEMAELLSRVQRRIAETLPCDRS